MFLGLAIGNYFRKWKNIWLGFTWRTGWLDYWNWRRIFGWIITGTYNRKTT